MHYSFCEVKTEFEIVTEENFTLEMIKVVFLCEIQFWFHEEGVLKIP